ncbi:MAG: T9SS type A sorting domain-containing protein [Dysgonamonadaceae bacterium]|jgi:hypothetical protein|nr:T9SS type A sorting domain-containing protein [Dysgonamonadaceae bacterium]
MKTIKFVFLMLCLSIFIGQTQAQQWQTVYDGTANSLPTAQGWNELRFDNTMPWEQDAKALLVAPGELSAIAGAALKLKVNKAFDANNYPLYSQLGWYKTRTGFSPSIGFTVEFKAKVIDSPDGSFSVSGVGGGKGFRLEFSNNKLVEHADVIDTVRVLSTASNTDAFHIYRVVVHVNDSVYVFRDGASLGALPLQSFKLDNILKDGGFENGESPLLHGWDYTAEGTPGALTVSNNPAYVHTGKYGLFVDKGTHKHEYIPVKPGAIYDMTAWGKTISYPTGDGHWRDFNGWHDPAGDKSVYFIGDRNNLNWKEYKKTGMEGGAHFQRFIPTTETGDANDNQMAYDDLYYSERITASRIPAGAVNLFPNGDFENPCAHYFPAGDPRNDTCMVNPDNYRYSADAYYGGQADADGWFNSTVFSAEHNAAPFWHPFWGARVRVQYNRQTGNNEAGNHWARGKYSLRFFNCGGARVEYGTDFSGGINENRGSNSEIKTVPIELEAGKKYTFLFSYHMAQWGGDGMTIIVKNGSKVIYTREAKGSDTYPDWRDEVIEFETDATDHALQIQTQCLSGNWEGSGGLPGVVYFDDLNLFQGELLPEDNTHLFFGKQTSVEGAEVDIEYIKIASGSYMPCTTGDCPLPPDPWRPKQAPLMTVWGEALTPSYPISNPILNEYPRPQLKREGWINLNGLWDFTGKAKAGFGTYSANDSYLQQILVPYPVESALSGIKDTEFANQNKTYSYKRTATIAKPTDSKRVILHFDAVDWESYVFVNGQEVAHHKGGFDPFSADITDQLNVSGTQEILVQVFDPAQGGQPTGKQNANPGGNEYSPASGIWQTVWAETVNPTYVTDITLTPQNNSAVKVKVEAADADGATATVKIFDGASQVATADVAIGAEVNINVPNPKLWSPETPFLYNVTVELKKAGATTDNVTSYFGMRKIEVKTLRDKPYVYLNDEPTFSFATLDHGYYPDGIYTPASYEAIRFDLNKLKEIGFNAVRKFEKIEPAIWYHIADSLGLLVWQDIPAVRTATAIAELNTEAARKANFLRETEAMTKSIRNFPSIVAWIAFNDSWGQFEGTIDHTKNTVNLLRSLADGRLIVPEAGGDHFELGDAVSSNNKPLPTMPANAYGERASISGITGGYNYVIDNHVWNTSASGDIPNDSTYAARLIEFRNEAANLTFAGLSGLAMVQTTDVENEVNGLITYDRKVYKAGVIADAVLKETAAFLKSKTLNPILKTSGQGGEIWKYINGTRGALAEPTAWNTVGFDDSSWKDGRSAFGGNMTVSFPWYTSWKGDNIELYLRKSVHIPQLAAGDTLLFKVFYDEDFEFYINGVLAYAASGWSTNYVSFGIYPEAKAAINYGGENLFAIHVVQGNGGSCMDLGVSALSAACSVDDPDCPAPAPAPVWKDIATATDWQNIENDLSGFYRVVADIDLFLSDYRMLGNADTPFRGYIDGQNHTITCPSFTGGANDRVGLFSYAVDAHFVNLRFVAADIEASEASPGGFDVGLLMGLGKGVHVEHVVFDYARGQAPDIYQNEVSGRDHVGIVAGRLEGGKLSTIKDVYVVNGKVESSEWQAGGLVGIMCDTRIINSYFTGTVSITHADRLTVENRDASGIASRTEGGHNYFYGVMSLADKIESASGNEFISCNGGGYIEIDSATCFARNDMALDPLFKPDRSGQYARATESMKRPVTDFQSDCNFYARAGWDMTNVWGMPIGGGFPIFRSIPDAAFEDCVVAVPVVKKENDLKVYSTGGNVVMSSTQPTAVWVYDLQGRLVERTDVNGTQTVVLPRGIYIVKSAANGNVKALKVINR